MRCKNIRCCHCGEYTPFITEENVEVIPQINLTRTDVVILGDIVETLTECGYAGSSYVLTRIQAEVSKIVEYQEEQVNAK